MTSINKFINNMHHYCSEVSVGYDQGRRWDVFDGGDTDCSALVITCLREAGFDTGNATYTGNMSSELCSRGWERLSPDLSTAQPGDILLNDANHVAAVLYGYGWDATIGQASIGDTGNIVGNQPGDQTGWETNETAIYNYPWDCILRYTGEDDEEQHDEESEFNMTECIFNIKDDHSGYLKGDILYWSPSAGFCYLEHPDCVALIKECNPDIKEIDSSSVAPWVIRAKQATNPTVAAKTFGKRN